MLARRAWQRAPEALSDWRDGRGRKRAIGVVVGVGAGLVAVEVVQRAREADLRGQVALVTGASRGLGLLLARELAREGCRLAICARDPDGLERARQDLAARGAEVVALPCDVADRAQVQRLVDEVTRHYGRIDVLVNNAGIIQVGPVQAVALEHFEQALGVMYWGVVYPTLAVLPQMRARGSGRIVNITSIGGKVAVPHLSPYTSAKFAAVGFSEGLRAELARDGITVTTVCPGLMRTGSHLNAWFTGDAAREFALFAPLASLPLVSIDAERAARQIVRATQRGEAERTLSLAAQVLARFHGLFPGTTTNLLGVVDRALPSASTPATSATRAATATAPGGGVRGMEALRRLRAPWFERLIGLGLSAARRFNQYPGPPPAPARMPQPPGAPLTASEAPPVARPAA
jgi:NAD(P)-dependent dehydrogenase (short-subunit alcohol dehydrogenase family)